MSGFYTCLLIISTLVFVQTAPEQYQSHASATEAGGLNHNVAPPVSGRIPPCAQQKDANMFSLIQAQSEGRIVNNQHNQHNNNVNHALETAASSSYPNAVSVNSQIAVGAQNPFSQQGLPLSHPIVDFNKPPQYNQNIGHSHQHQISQNSGYHYATNFNSNQFIAGQSNAGYVYQPQKQQSLPSNAGYVYQPPKLQSLPTTVQSNAGYVYQPPKQQSIPIPLSHGSSNNFNSVLNNLQQSGQFGGSFSHHNQQNQQFLGSHSVANNAFDGQLGQIIQETVSQTSLDPSAEKHIYVHVPPEDLEEQKSHQTVHSVNTQPRKHYKIIFIKAPTYPSQNAAQLVAAAPPPEEKTLIYVLVKKPEEPSYEELQQIQQTTVKHNKPEVYFIKYKTNKESEGAIETLSESNYFGGNNDIDVRLNSGESSDISFSNSYSTSSVSSSASSINGHNKIIKPHEEYGVPSVQ